MTPHIWWHLALFHIEKEEHETALQLFDEKIKFYAFKGGEASMKIITDATSLLLRLQMEGKPKGVDLNDRWRELGRFCEAHYEEWCVGSNFFFDFHTLISLLFGGRPAAADNVMQIFRDVSKDTLPSTSKMLRKAGLTVAAGLKYFAEGDYVAAVDTLSSVRHQMLSELGGSTSQLVLLELVMLRSAVLAGSDRRQLAEKLLEEHVASCFESRKSTLVKSIENHLLSSQIS